MAWSRFVEQYQKTVWLLETMLKPTLMVLASRASCAIQFFGQEIH